MYTETHLQQHVGEIQAFGEILKREGARSYLEIGSKFGGSFWKVAHYLPQGSRMVSVDMPHGNGYTLPHLKECLKKVNATFGHEVVLIIGDSTDREIINQARSLGPFDATLVDANHTLSYVTRDYAAYLPMTKMIAFHDINFTKSVLPGRMQIEVKQFWDKAKLKHDRFEEIVMCKEDNGIGMLWT